MAKIKKKNLLRIGFDEGKALKLALEAMQHEAFAKKDREAKEMLLQSLLAKPEGFYKHSILGETAHALKADEEADKKSIFPELRENGLPLKIYGARDIEPATVQQMEIASRLPIAIGAALMPDAHRGYGLPIGGVLATENEVIPFAVGVDIGCRMCLSVYDLPESYVQRNTFQLKKSLLENTVFGAGKGFDKPMDHAVLDRKEFQEIDVIRRLKDKAWKQIGSSGGGNHFVEFGVVELSDPQNEFGLKPGSYLGVLSHSGSRGLGAGIANHFTKLAMDKTRLPKEARHLAWLGLDSEEGIAYWKAMTLAGDYASACHDQIHQRLSKDLGEKPLFIVENHHNFAWREQLSSKNSVIVHRKGATPASVGVLGIIPGSMTSPGFIVRGKGNEQSINSASHGAGRKMSRIKARNNFTQSELKKILKKHDVSLIGGGVDEAPMVYKDIQTVMKFQEELVDIVGEFHPKIVRMAKD